MEVWFNPRCSKCRIATEALDEAGLTYQLRYYLEQPPSTSELRDVLARLELEPWDICRTADASAGDTTLPEARDAAHREDWIAFLSAHPALPRSSTRPPERPFGWSNPCGCDGLGNVSEQWRAPAVDRVDPDRIADERTAFDQLIDWQRATLLTKCAGLTAEQLKQRAVPPSALSLLGLVRHMTEVERWWFRMHANREDLPFPTPDQDGADFDDTADADAASNLAAYRQELDAARAAVADKDLDHVVPSLGHHPERTRDLRWIYLHMIDEYARHNGHADLLREVIDGTTGE